MNVFVFGIGYSASFFLRRHRDAFGSVAGTVRTRDRVADLARLGIQAHLFDGATADPAIGRALGEADAVLVSVQPSGTAESAFAGHDPVLGRFDLAAAPRLKRIAYLSTIGVYGDHGGAWIDESTPPEPSSGRGRIRLAVEDEWLALGALSGKQVAVLRLAGIYGPGRNVLDDLRDGTARRIDKPGQVFNRIHVADIAGAIAASFRHPAPHGVWNVTDDEPAPASDVVGYGARLLGIEPPPLVPFADAELSPMARSFYGANRRVSNDALKRKLGAALLYPTYRHGLDALLAGTRDGSVETMRDR